MTKIILVSYWEIETGNREGEDWWTTSEYKSTFEIYKYVPFVNCDGSIGAYICQS